MGKLKTIDDYGFSLSRAPNSNTYWGRVRAYPANGEVPTKESKRFVHNPETVLASCSFEPTADGLNTERCYAKNYNTKVILVYTEVDYIKSSNQHDRNVSLSGLEKDVLLALQELKLKAY